MSENLQSIWNFDDRVAFMLGELKANFLQDMHTWNLEDAYSHVRLIWVETDAKLNNSKKEYPDDDPTILKLTQQEHAEKQINLLEESRSIFLAGRLDPGEFYKQLEDFYRLICSLMKKNGLYFRESLHYEGL